MPPDDDELPHAGPYRVVWLYRDSPDACGIVETLGGARMTARY